MKKEKEKKRTSAYILNSVHDTVRLLVHFGLAFVENYDFVRNKFAVSLLLSSI